MNALDGNSHAGNAAQGALLLSATKLEGTRDELRTLRSPAILSTLNIVLSTLTEHKTVSTNATVAKR